MFEFIRVVELYGPLFGGMKDYDFKQIETESGDYTFQFKTKKSRYPNKTFLSCQGMLTIDRRTRKLKLSILIMWSTLCVISPVGLGKL